VRSLSRLLAAGALVLALAGCTIEGDLAIGTDDTVSGAFVVAVGRSALAESDTSEEEFLDELDRLNPVQSLPARRWVYVEPYLGDNQIGRRYSYDKVPLAEFNDGASWRILRSGDSYLVGGEMDLASFARKPGVGAAARAEAGWTVVVRMTFPGRIQTTNGTMEDAHTVVWRADAGERIELAAEAGEGSAEAAAATEAQTGLARLGVDRTVVDGPGRWVVAAGVAAETAVAFSAFLLWRRRRRAAFASAAWRARPRSGPRGRHRAR
jgi:hypothetical protein